MNDDQLDVNQVAGEEASISESSAEEPKATEEVETLEADTTVDAPEETQTETEEAPKKGANARIRELNREKRVAEEKAKSLEDIVAKLRGSGEPSVPQAPYIPQQTQYEPIVRPGEELDASELDRRIQEREQRIIQQINAQSELKNLQNETITRHVSELAEVRKAYPELDPESEHFNKELSDSVTDATEAYLWANPYKASAKQFVGKLMKPYQRAVTKEVGKATENLARQVTQAATRPTSVSTAGGKSDGEKSIAELEAELGIHY